MDEFNINSLLDRCLGDVKYCGAVHRGAITPPDEIEIIVMCVKLERAARVITAFTLKRYYDQGNSRERRINNATGKTSKYNDNRLLLAYEPACVLEAYIEGKINIEHIKILDEFDDIDMKRQLIEMVTTNDMSAMMLRYYLNDVIAREANKTPDKT